MKLIESGSEENLRRIVIVALNDPGWSRLEKLRRDGC